MNSAIASLTPYLNPGVEIGLRDGFPAVPFDLSTEGMKANAYYFNHEKWVRNWLASCHRYPEYVERWRAATGNWEGKIVVDVGCGPGNVHASVGGNPELLIGVDIAPFSLRLARESGYVPLLADAHKLPLRSGFADIVAVSSTLHHVDDMARVLAEAARLVRPGGMLVTDHDPLSTANDFKGLGLLMWNLRVPLYRLMNRGGHSPEEDEQKWAMATEIHHMPGEGVTPKFFQDALLPLAFDVQLYSHNNNVGAAIFEGQRGKAFFAFRAAQRLSGIDPAAASSAMTMMCVATRRH